MLNILRIHQKRIYSALNYYIEAFKKKFLGRAEEGCQSIVLAGGYEDDTDLGFEFFYTGCGGRDLSGNKRTAAQSFDQVIIWFIYIILIFNVIFIDWDLDLKKAIFYNGTIFHQKWSKSLTRLLFVYAP